MIILSFFESIGELAEILVEGGVEFCQIVRDSGNDIAEAAVQEVKNFINGESNKAIHTSYDIKKESQERIFKINQKYYNKKKDVQQLWEKIRSYSDEVSKKRNQVYWMLGTAMHNSHLIALPNADSFQINLPDSPFINNLLFELGTTLGSTSLRMKAAEDYEQESKEHEVKVKSIINEMNQIERRAIAFKHLLEEESTMLESIESSYLQQSEGVMEETVQILRSIANECINTINSKTQKGYFDLLNQLRKLWG